MRAPISRPVESRASIVHIYIFAFVVDVPIAEIVVFGEGLERLFFLGAPVVIWVGVKGEGDGRHRSLVCIWADGDRVTAVRHPNGTKG